MTNYFTLPDSIESSKLQGYFIEYLAFYSNSTNPININNALSELLELADRQWHAYELLEEGIKIKIEDFLESVIDFEDEEIMEYILCIIPRIGLNNLFSFILGNKGSIHNEKVLSNIIESENEYGNNVNNPYSGMK